MPCKQLGRGRRGHAAPAVGDFDRAAARRNRRADNPLDAEQVPADRRADDIGNRIDRADFVEMHFADRRAVNLGLRFAQPGEDLAWPALFAARSTARGRSSR